MQDLKDKVVIITGGAKGIGKACVYEFIKYNAKVVFTYNSSSKDAENIIEELKTQNCFSLKCDVKDYKSCRNVIEEAINRFGRVDILVNNAGILRDKPLFLMLPEDWDEVISTNLYGTFNMTRAIITTFLKQKNGCIINISSVSGLVGLAGQTNYSASKGGIIAFSKALAKEVAGYNIRVNVICPGFIQTDMLNTLKDDLKKKLIDSIPLKRFGKPKDVANLCVFLASDISEYITGEVIKVDGGLAI